MTDLNLGRQSEFWPLGLQVAGMFSYFQAPSPLWDDTDTHFYAQIFRPIINWPLQDKKNK